jgi:hypothetical protein
LAIAVSLSVMIFWIGLYPAPFLNMMNGSLQALVDRLHRPAAAATDRKSMIADRGSARPSNQIVVQQSAIIDPR